MSKPLSAPHFRDVLLLYVILLPGVGFVLRLGNGLYWSLYVSCFIALFSFPGAALTYWLCGRRMRWRWRATLVSALGGVFSIPLVHLISCCISALQGGPVGPDFPWGFLLMLILSALVHAVSVCFYCAIRVFVHLIRHYFHSKQSTMSDTLIIRKMQQEGLSQAAISMFLHSVQELRRHANMQVPEADIRPAEGLPVWEELVAATESADAALLRETALIKLNGGLGTSMGLQQAKSLLEIKPGLTFLDLIVRQVQTLREQSGSHVQLLLMNSFSTSADTMRHLSRYAEGGFADPAEVEMLHNKVPKLAQDTLEPVSWPARPELEWCPPGHGDIYAALAGSGWLEKLLARGIKYAFISNSDNLGAQLDTRFLRWFAESGAPFVMEVTPRTEADKKGGHLAIRRGDNQPILREVAQCPAEDMPAFQDITRHRFFNTNNLWIRLDVLRDFMAAHGGIVPLPVICNAKHLDPRDAATPAIYQLETAMGAALQCFPGARAVCVPRSRFFPVKTCSDLLLLRSDAVEISPEGAMSLAPECGGKAPVISLDSAHYKLVDSLAALGVPSLKHVTRLTVHGQWSFAPGEPLSGEVEVGS